MTARPKRWLAIFLACIGLAGVLFMNLPSGFLPEEDQGTLMLMVQLPAGASEERTYEVLTRVERYFNENEAESVASVMTVSGVSFSGTGENGGLGFIKLKDWSERGSADMRVPAILARANREFSRYPEAQVFVFAPPAVMELGNATGFDFELVDRANMGHEALMEARDTLLAKARAHPALQNVRHNGFDDVEEYKLQIDMAKAGAQSLTKGEINAAVSAYWGSSYVNDFMDKGRTKKVYLQADTPFRMQAEDFNRYYVRNSKGEMVPFSSFLTMTSSQGSPRLERFGGSSAVEILGEPAPGYSSGQAMDVMESLMNELPDGFGYSWTSISYQEKLSGSQAPLLYAISLVVVFLCLAALYESWTIPLSVLLVVPFGVVGALVGVFLRDMNNDIYFQIGILTVIGLSAKNSILIVEFAKDLYANGYNLYQSVVQAARLRLRPIVMTSLCFILGVMPLMTSSGAGAGGQNALGTTVVFGVLVATTLGVYFTPIFFVVVTALFTRKRTTAPARTVAPVSLQEGESHA